MCGGGATEHGYTGSDGGSGLFGWRLGLTSNRQRSKGQCHQDKGPGKYRAVLGRNLCQCITSWGAGVNCFSTVVVFQCKILTSFLLFLLNCLKVVQSKNLRRFFMLQL